MDIGWVAATTTQGESLAEIRVQAMRESLERIGRFDPQRARDRFLSSFSPECTTVIELAGRPVGFYVLRRRESDLYLDHLYVTPTSQARGLGAAALSRLLALADSLALDIRLGALKQSDANRFYQRHGFVLEDDGEFDNYYVRRCRSAIDPVPGAPVAPHRRHLPEP